MTPAQAQDNLNRCFQHWQEKYNMTKENDMTKLAVQPDTLLKFDINEYRADPSRLRHGSGRTAKKSEEFDEFLVVHWTNFAEPVVYNRLECITLLRLAPRTRKIGIRVLRDYKDGTYYAYTEQERLLNDENVAWVTDVILVEVPQ